MSEKADSVVVCGRGTSKGQVPAGAVRGRRRGVIGHKMPFDNRLRFLIAAAGLGWGVCVWAQAPGGPDASSDDKAAAEEVELGRSIAGPKEQLHTRRYLKGARSAAERGDWKLAVDNLQRLIEQPAGEMVAVSTSQYVSASRYATRMVAELGPEVLDAYRLVYDAEAKALLERGRAAHDEAALYEVLKRFLQTRYGGPAADTLAGWLIDQGRWGEALAVLQVLRYAADPGVPAWAVGLKRAIALAGTGDVAAAQRTLSGLEAAGVSGDRLSAARRWIDAQRTGQDRFESAECWPRDTGNNAATAAMAPVNPASIGRLPWKHQLKLPSGGPSPEQLAQAVHLYQLIPTCQMAATEQCLMVKTPYRMVALRPGDLKKLWEPAAPPLRPLSRNASAVQRRLVFVGGRLSQQSRQNPFLQHPLFADRLATALSVCGPYAYCIEPEGSSLFRGEDEDARVQVFGGGQGRVMVMINGRRQQSDSFANALAAYDLRSEGKLVWSRGRSGSGKDPLGTVRFLTAPLALGPGELLVSYHTSQEIRLGVLD